MPMLGYCTSSHFAEHLTGPHHPERPDRIRAIIKAVDEANLDLLRIDPTPADVKWITEIHSQKYIDRIRHVAKIGGGVLDQGDTPIGAESFDIALLAIGGLLNCCDAVMNGKVNRAFAAVRPPGHHAE